MANGSQKGVARTEEAVSDPPMPSTEVEYDDPELARMFKEREDERRPACRLAIAAGCDRGQPRRRVLSRSMPLSSAVE
jgi:hypothetical protein